MEIWKIIEEFPRFEISDQGRVRNARNGKIKKITYTLRPQVGLEDESGWKTTRKIDRLVAEAFLPVLPNPEWFYDEPMHIDGNPDNNRASNLRWQRRNGVKRR